MSSTPAPSVDGVYLRSLRERLGLSRLDVARLAGCGVSSLIHIEHEAVHGRSRVYERAVAVLEALDAEGQVTA